MEDNQNVSPSPEDDLHEEDKAGEQILNDLKDFGAKQKEAEKKTRIITLSVIAVLVIAACWFGDRIIRRETLGKARLSEGIGELAVGLRLFAHPSGPTSNFACAIKSFDMAISQDKSFADAYYLRGVTYFYMYAYEKNKGISTTADREAETDLTRSIKLKRNYPEAYIYLGTLYYLKSMPARATPELDKGIKVANKIWKNSTTKRERWINFAVSVKEKIKNNQNALLLPPYPEEIK
ncbi:MAG TPA: hypothetical protein PL110_05625 [Candidatus Eremiobacteraeota bacterium]|nr:MAG: hypothetical protein BWY64_00217 [bacterium ADurb.Bin363]HPZ07572.1 hypothetical protein [Candidatus Eremiobacteraeota bacterium]